MNKGHIKGFVPAILWSILIIVLSAVPGETMESYSITDLWNIDKLGHFVVYGIHTYLLLLGYQYLKGKTTRKHRILALILSILLGILMELFQYSFFTDRHFDILDLIANIIGSLMGLIIFNFLKT